MLQGHPCTLRLHMTGHTGTATAHSDPKMVLTISIALEVSMSTAGQTSPSKVRVMVLAQATAGTMAPGGQHHILPRVIHSIKAPGNLQQPQQLIKAVATMITDGAKGRRTMTDQQGSQVTQPGPQTDFLTSPEAPRQTGLHTLTGLVMLTGPRMPKGLLLVTGLPMLTDHLTQTGQEHH